MSFSQCPYARGYLRKGLLLSPESDQENRDQRSLLPECLLCLNLEYIGAVAVYINRSKVLTNILLRHSSVLLAGIHAFTRIDSR